MAKFVRAAQLIRQFKQSAAPTVAQGLTVDDIWVDTDDHATYVCTAISPVTFTALGSGGTPGGSNTYVQYNDSSSFGGDSGFTYNKTTHALTITGAMSASNLSGTNTGDQTLPTDATITTTDVTTNNVSTSKHGWAPKGDGITTKFLNANGAYSTPAADSDATLTFTDITTNNSSTSNHGFLKKLNNTSTNYMDGTGNWSTPAGTYTTPLTTKGDIEVYDSANSRLAVGSDLKFLYADSSTSSGLAYDYRRNQQSSSLEYFTDLTSTSGSDTTVRVVVNGTGAAIATNHAQATDGTRLAVNQFTTGTTNTGSALQTFPSSSNGFTFYIGNGQIIIETDILLDQVSNGTDRFSINFGLANASVIASITNYVTISYIDNVNSAHWVLTATDGTPATANGSTGPSASTWYRLKLVITSSLVTGYVNDVSIGTVSTHIPTGVALIPTLWMLKSVGTTACTMEVDWYYVRKDFTSAR